MSEKNHVVERKKLSEIVTRLVLEPSIREMYVEGIFDRDFYKEALKAFGINDVQIYPIDTVEVPAELLKEWGLTSGNRQRVQAAAKSLESNKNIHGQLLLLIDADFDHVLNVPIPNLPLVRTEEAAAELILWDKRVLERFFSLVLARQNAALEVAETMPLVEKVACEAFLFRLAKDRVANEWKTIDIAEVMSAKENFCVLKYCDKVASKNSGHAILKNDILPLMENYRNVAEALTVGKKMHGHDLMSVLAKQLQIKGLRNAVLSDPTELGRTIMASTDWKELLGNPTLQILRAKFLR